MKINGRENPNCSIIQGEDDPTLTLHCSEASLGLWTKKEGI
jgi:hypothetical protein